ncbi:hypothetical protein BH09PSE1_BH09PSE1_25340 [soil metagenome]
MVDLTLTDMRKYLFAIIDRMIERGEPVRFRRGKVSVELTAKVVETPSTVQTRAERLDRMMALGPRADTEDRDFDHTDKSHRQWDHWSIGRR